MSRQKQTMQPQAQGYPTQEAPPPGYAQPGAYQQPAIVQQYRQVGPRVYENYSAKASTTCGALMIVLGVLVIAFNSTAIGIDAIPGWEGQRYWERNIREYSYADSLLLAGDVDTRYLAGFVSGPPIHYGIIHRWDRLDMLNKQPGVHPGWLRGIFFV